MVLCVKRPVIFTNAGASFDIAHRIHIHGGAFEVTHNAGIARVIEQCQCRVQAAANKHRFCVSFRFGSNQIENFMWIELNEL